MTGFARGSTAGLLVVWLLAGCSPATPSPAVAPQGATAAPALAPGRTLVLATNNEPDALTTAMGGGLNIATPIRLFNAGVATRDQQGVAQPYLAEALPQLNTDSWRVFPDGPMETVYRLKPNLTWHDGAPLTAADFVFGWRVYSTPEVGVSSRPPQAHMEEITAPDPRTVVIRWRRPYPDADTLLSGSNFDFVPLPRHVLEQPFEEERPDVFAALPFWTRDYVGLGPFRLERWDPGAFIEGSAFAGHALGRPQIDRIRVVFFQDPNTTLASMLAGEIHVTDDTPLSFTQGTVLRREWAARNGGVVLFTPTLLTYTGVQQRPDVVRPRALLDVRARQALTSGIDRQALNDGLFDGEGLAAETVVVPPRHYYDTLMNRIARSAYEPLRTEQLLSELEYTRGSDGFFTSAAEGRFVVENRIAEIGEHPRASDILVDTWRRLGIDASTSVFASSLINDGQFRASYPSLDSTGTGVTESNVRSLGSGAIPRPENRWTGQNRGSWSNPEYDRLIEAFDTTLDRSQRDQQIIQMMKLVSEELPWIPLYYNLRVVAHAAAVQGVQIGSPETPKAWNVHQWEFR